MEWDVFCEMIIQTTDFKEAKESAKLKTEEKTKLPTAERLKDLDNTFSETREILFFRRFTPKSKYNDFKLIEPCLGFYADTQFSELFLDSIRDSKTIKEKLNTICVFGKNLNLKRVKTTLKSIKKRKLKELISIQNI
ncbi:hypothetical protein KO317_02545 [Candidatus Micrarchaeota archaeon]|jgi:hypothetical protein|nr:hypothetical protein [Candidatus Micrarchaeota archaeon]